MNKNKSYPFFSTLFASLMKSLTFVPMRERQKTATLILSLARGTFAISHAVTWDFLFY